MTVASGTISYDTLQLVNTSIFIATEKININFIQFISEHGTAVTLNVWMQIENELVRLCIKDKSITNAAPFYIDKMFTLEQLQSIIVQVSTIDVVHFIVDGDLVPAEEVPSTDLTLEQITESLLTVLDSRYASADMDNNFQPASPELTALASIIATNGDFIKRIGDTWNKRTTAEVKADLDIDNIETSLSQKTSRGLVFALKTITI